MDLLIDDMLIEILKLVNTRELIKFSMTSKYNQSFFRKYIRNFRIDASQTTITDAGLKHLKDVHTIHLSLCKQITDAGLEHLKGAIII